MRKWRWWCPMWPKDVESGGSNKPWRFPERQLDWGSTCSTVPQENVQLLRRQSLGQVAMNRLEHLYLSMWQSCTCHNVCSTCKDKNRAKKAPDAKKWVGVRAGFEIILPIWAKPILEALNQQHPLLARRIFEWLKWCGSPGGLPVTILENNRKHLHQENKSGSTCTRLALSGCCSRP